MATHPMKWQQLDGQLTHVSLGGPQHVAGVNAAGNLFHRNGPGGQWKQLPGQATNVSVGHDGEMWCCNAQGNVFRWDGANWQQSPNAIAKQISVGSAQHIACTNQQNDTFVYKNGGWVNAGHKLAWVSIDSHGNMVGVGPAHKALWQSNGGPWTKLDIPGEAAKCTVGNANNGKIAFVNNAGNVYHRHGAGWKVLEGQLTQCSMGPGGAIVGVNSAQTIFKNDPVAL